LRWLALAFVALIVVLQYPMWLGKGGWLQVREFDRQLAGQKEANAKLKVRNDALDADVRDLKAGVEAIEERARSELGMVKQDEVFFQLRQRPESGTGERRDDAKPPSPGTTSMPIRPSSSSAEKR
jgi:cell division protein FtsB